MFESALFGVVVQTVCRQNPVMNVISCICPVVEAVDERAFGKT